MLLAVLFSEGLGLKFQRKFFQYCQYFIQAIKKPNWFLMFVLGSIALIRRFALLLSKRPFIQSYGKEPSLFEQLDADSVTEILKQDGFYLKINLPKKTRQDIQDFASKAIYFGEGNPNF
ncbi:MAG TPA: hypothetical protein DEV81_22205, partial [Cyanobacteria bacterium UBA11049]|nr:hypothetical protein [Cyanobacteria bacterium UBA11049]